MSDTKNIVCSSMGIEFTVSGLPATVEKFDEMAQRPGACLEAALSNYLAHNHFSKVRAAVVKALADATGIARKVEKDGDREVFAETENQYVKRATAELESAGDSIDNYMDALTEAAAAVEVDLTKQIRGAGSDKVAAKWITAAEQIRDAGKLDAVAAKLGVELGNDEEENLSLVGAAVRDFEKKKIAEARAALATL